MNANHLEPGRAKKNFYNLGIDDLLPRHPTERSTFSRPNFFFAAVALQQWMPSQGSPSGSQRHTIFFLALIVTCDSRI